MCNFWLALGWPVRGLRMHTKLLDPSTKCAERRCAGSSLLAGTASAGLPWTSKSSAAASCWGSDPQVQLTELLADNSFYDYVALAHIQVHHKLEHSLLVLLFEPVGGCAQSMLLLRMLVRPLEGIGASGTGAPH
eukprot:1160888-Pelagomonas_calceolata.AAC.10